MPSAIGHKLAVVSNCGPLRQAVLEVVEQDLGDGYLEAIRCCVGWDRQSVEQLLEGGGLLRSSHVVLEQRPLFIGQQTNDVLKHAKPSIGSHRGGLTSGVPAWLPERPHLRFRGS